MPKKQPKRGRLWSNDASCVCQKAEYPNHLWSYDFAFEPTHDGHPLRILAIIDEYTRECLALDVARRMTSEDVIYCLGRLIIKHGVPYYIRSDNGPEFTAWAVKESLERLNVQILFIEPGCPCENGYVESFNGKLRDELLHQETFYTLEEPRILIGRWRHRYNTMRSHSSLGYKVPVPETIKPQPVLIKMAEGLT